MVIKIELQESINRKKIRKLKLYTIVFVVISILSFSIAIYQLIHLGTSQNVSFMYNYIAGILPAYFASYFIVDGVPYLQYYRNTIRGKIQRGTFGLWTYLNISPAFYYPFLSFVMDNFGQPSLLAYILNIGVPIIMSSVLEFIPIHYWRINRRLKSNIYQH